MKKVLKLGVLLALTGCGDPVEEAQASGLSASDSTAARQKIEELYPPSNLPEYAPAAPVSLAVCDTEPCILLQVQFVNRDWPAAWQGDYEGQQNVASCRETGCEMAVAIDKLEACAWRVTVIAAHPDEATELDADMADQACGSLTPTQREAAQAKMHSLIDQIYGA